MKLAVAAYTDFGSFAAQMRDRNRYRREYVRVVTAEPGARGRVLDIGCGPGVPTFLAGIRDAARELDGIDPDPAVLQHPQLNRRWHGRLEDDLVPAGAYDLAYSYNVVEHVPAAAPFLRAVRRVLKPGGVFWALTPNGRHPFCTLSRGIELIGLKGLFARRLKGVNDYPAYYRLNTPAQVRRAAAGAGFASAAFHFIPCCTWDSYFPRPLRWAPNLYDRLLGTRSRPFMQLVAYRLQADDADPAAAQLPRA